LAPASTSAQSRSACRFEPIQQFVGQFIRRDEAEAADEEGVGVDAERSAG
jgi:hypothetical protein